MAKLLVIDDNVDSRLNLKNILDFVGEPCEVIGSEHIADLHWSTGWVGCIIGHISLPSVQQKIRQQLIQSNHIPILAFDQQYDGIIELPNFVGELVSPLNYAQLSSALKCCKDFLGRKDLSPYSGRKNTLFRSLVGKSAGIQEVRHLIQQVSNTDASVLILGESGTGKEVVARNLHYHSSRREGPFVPINCGAIPADLLESELFGHEKGAFTGAISARKGRFELAAGGTIFLDEIGDMPMPMQVKLLGVLQERTFERVGGSKVIKANVRVVTATHQNLEQMISAGKFREDLFYRLNVFPIEMPSLQQRKQDIPLLLQELMARMEAEGASPISFTQRATNSLMEHHWPGNVRELANLVERMIILFPNSLIDVNQLPMKYRYSDIPEFQPENMHTDSDNLEHQEQDALLSIFSGEASFADIEEVTDNAESQQTLPPEGVNLKEVLAEFEVDMIEQALDAQGGVVSRAADMLGMRRTTLVEKMRKYELQRN